MKNAKEKTQVKTAGQRDNTTILYNVKPGRAYLVKKEDVMNILMDMLPVVITWALRMM